jgi:hypothetical protein
MKTALRSLVVFSFLIATCLAQTLNFPVAPQIGGQYYRGVGGTTSIYYWVIAHYPSGTSGLSNLATFPNTPGTTSSSDRILINWTPPPGSVSFDVLRNLTGTAPTGACNCAVAIAQSKPNFSDRGAPLLNYTVDTPNVGMNSISVDATTTGITLDQARLINGVLSHAPTGAVNDVTDTAANIVAALPGCYGSSVGGTSFTFILRNTSAGANTITVTPGTGVTLTGTMTVAQNFYRSFSGIVTNCTTPAVTLFSLGTGAF